MSREDLRGAMKAAADVHVPRPSRAISWTSWPRRATPSSSNSVRAPRDARPRRRGAGHAHLDGRSAVIPSDVRTSRPPCSAIASSPGHGRAGQLPRGCAPRRAARHRPRAPARGRRLPARVTADALTAPVPPPRGAGTERACAPTGAGVVLAVLLGALPAALVGLERVADRGRGPGVPGHGPPSPGDRPSPSRSERAENTATPRRADHAVRSRTHGTWRRARPPARRRRGRLGSSRERAPRLAVPRLRTGIATRVTIPVRLGARGHHDAVTLRVTSSFPFSLVHAARAPRSTASHGAAAPARPGGARARRALRADDPRGRVGRPRRRMRTSGLPVGLRHARSGDRARDIDARASIRKSRWMPSTAGPARRPGDRGRAGPAREGTCFLVSDAQNSPSRPQWPLRSAVEPLLRTHGAVTLEESLPPRSDWTRAPPLPSKPTPWSPGSREERARRCSIGSRRSTSTAPIG